MKNRILFLLLLMVLASFSLWFWWLNSIQPVNLQDRETRIFVVQKGESIRQVARRLEEGGLIRSKLAIFLLMKSQGIEKNIQAGTFRLSASMTPEAIIKELAHGTLDIWVTIIEGWRAEEVADYLRKTLPETADYHSYLEAVSGREGYLFPDTYLIPKDASASAVVDILLANFEKKFSKEIEEDARKTGFTREQVVVLASIVEREAKYDEDRPMVAGILLNRLNEGMPLQADATVQYAVAGVKCKVSEMECTWWPKNLTKDDLKIDSPYNTYLNTGLPPASISSPGLAAIKAAAQPAKTDYLFYLSDQDGHMHYAKTLDEHNENIRKYLSTGVTQ